MTAARSVGESHDDAADSRSATDAPAADTLDADTLVIGTLDTPVGTLTVVASPRGVRAVLWPGEQYDDTGRVRPRRDGETSAATATRLAATGHVDGATDADRAGAVLHDAIAQLGEYFDGSRTQFDVALDPLGTPFQQDAWRILRTIPFGRTMTYGEQARALGDANKARAVGAANGKNPISIIVPCHRVVGGSGSLTGFAGGLEAKSWLLRHERRLSGVSDLGL